MRRSRGGAHSRRGPRIDRFAAVLAAAGTGTRARDGRSSVIPKQFELLRDRPLLAWALDALRDCARIVIAAPAEHVDRVRAMAPDATVVVGGASRQDSVRNALASIETPLVIVHDAARPLASPGLVARVVGGVGSGDGAVPAVPLEDTIKIVDAGVVIRTLDRRSVWRIQTPQAFRTEALTTAHERAAAEGFTATDDAQLLEHYGMKVAVVNGDAANIKVTHRRDFALAEALLGST